MMQAQFMNEMKCPKGTVRKYPHKIMFQTCREYASSTTAHGFSYVVEQGNSVAERILWSIIVVLALMFTTSQMSTLYMEWQNDPVITTLDTVALPIEEVQFPAITICPQGSVHGILDAVLFKQFKEYVSNKTRHGYTRRKRSKASKSLSGSEDEDVWHLNSAQIELEGLNFLRDVYPGAKDKPTKLVSLLTTNDPKKMLENEALIQPNGKNEECDSSENDQIVKDLNKQLNKDFCPDNFELVDGIGCLHSSGIDMSYDEADRYCADQDGSNILTFNTYQELKTIQNKEILGM